MNNLTYSLTDLIAKQRAEFLSFRSKPYVPREVEARLRAALTSPLIKIVMGPRRAGKSRLIQKVLEEELVAYINFEEELFSGCTGEEIFDAATKVYPYAKFWYLDEIQDFKEWEKLLNKFHRRRFNLIVTGSNSKLLSSELASALTGRHVPIELLPFSYAEFISAKKVARGWESFKAYLIEGGFPDVLLNSGIDSKTYLNTLFDSIVLKDLIRRKKIRNPAYLTNCISLLIDNVASRTSARALARALKNTPSAITLDKYIEMLREAYVFETVGAYSDKPRQRIQSERKPYIIDTGIISARSHQVLPLLGRQLENAVYLKLRRDGLEAGASIFYYQNSDGSEVDFMTRTGRSTTHLIQVCLDLASIKTREREVHALAKAAENNPSTPLTIVTADERGSVTTDVGARIEIVPGYEFC